jgi:hypothetical protein
MQLEQRDKELAAVGASIGCNAAPASSTTSRPAVTPDSRTQNSPTLSQPRERFVTRRLGCSRRGSTNCLEAPALP